MGTIITLPPRQQVRDQFVTEAGVEALSTEQSKNKPLNVSKSQQKTITPKQEITKIDTPPTTPTHAHEAHKKWER